MKSWIFIFMMIIESSVIDAQISSIVKDSLTGFGVPYASVRVESRNVDTVSDQNGVFTLNILPEDFVTFSAIGYKTVRLKLGVISGGVNLVRKPIEIPQVIIRSTKRTKKFMLGDFSKSEIINGYNGGYEAPFALARYFPATKELSEMPFVKTIEIATFNHIPKATFNVSFYSVGDDGAPDNLLADKIIGTAEEGRHITKIDLSTQNIVVPAEGFFVVYESLMNADNMYLLTGTDITTGITSDHLNCMPAVEGLPADSNDSSCTYSKGLWRKVNRYYGSNSNYFVLAVKLTLTN